MAIFQIEIIDKIIIHTKNIDLIDQLCTDHSIKQFYYKNQNICSWKTACKLGCIKLVKIMHKNELEKYKNRENLIKIQDRSEVFCAIAWLREHHYLECSTIHGGKSSFCWLKNNESRSPYIAMDLAIKNNHLEIVKYMHDNGYKCSLISIDYAASRGHIEMVKWLHENGYKYTTDAIRLAKINRRYDVIEYLESSLNELDI